MSWLRHEVQDKRPDHGVLEGIAMIQLRDIRRYFPAGSEKNWVLRGVNLDVKEGEFLTIMGPSGSGKSTLLAVVGLLDSAWTGEYYFMTQPVHRLDPRKRNELNKRCVGFVFQHFHLLDGLTVQENLEIPLSYRGHRPAERAALTSEILKRFDLEGKRNQYPSRLSGGHQQLVAVARAVVGKPKLILADEPTGNLHSEAAREIMELFQKLNGEGTTIVQVTHSEVNAAYSRRVIQLLDGQIVSG
jgi:ABC-type lipoprotein export system ATPase subunit